MSFKSSKLQFVANNFSAVKYVSPQSLDNSEKVELVHHLITWITIILDSFEDFFQNSIGKSDSMFQFYFIVTCT